MPELLFELGCEELPAHAVASAAQQLQDQIAGRLAEAHLSFGRVERYATPRRLIVGFFDVLVRQPDQSKEVRGPALKAAFGPDEQPTQALIGFCRSQGVDVGSVRKEGDYVWITKEIAGRATSEVLVEILPASVRALTFDKTMRWGEARMRFARPIRWMLASFDGACVEFSIENVASGLKSRGHRFEHPEEFEATNLADLLRELRARQVEPCPETRRTRIVEGARSVATGTPEMTDALIDENVFLTEWPQALLGEFTEGYLDLPEPVLVTAMAKHERFFPVRQADGRLTNQFISIRNGGEEATVRRGNAWVLSARFNDAKFFFDEDRRRSMDDFLAATERMTFQEKLGSVRARADRLEELCEAVAGDPMARQAGLYAKADLATGLVSELASLQGIVGGFYAKRAGMPEAVCNALATQYDLSKITSDQPVSLAGFVADQVDKLAGYLGQGLVPSGSSDPYGLRRAATQLIEAEWLAGKSLDLGGLLRKAVAGYAAQGVQLDEHAVLERCEEIMASRYGVLLPEARYDLLEAAMGLEVGYSALDAHGLKLRLAAISELGTEAVLVQTATRPINILAAARKKGTELAAELKIEDLDSESGVALANALANSDDIRALVPAINAFFDQSMIMAEDERVRGARLALVAAVVSKLIRVGDWTKIVVDG